MTIQATIASPAIQVAAAAWWATSVTTPTAGQRIEREWPANAHVPSRPMAGIDTAVQYTSRCTTRYWDSTIHSAPASAMRSAMAMPANVVVAASIEPLADHGASPLTSEATTKSCASPSAPVAMSDCCSTRRSTGCSAAPGHTLALTRRMPTTEMMAR